MVWTFDPLVRRNAVLNLVRLGATVSGFEPDFYGEMPDAINAGDPTDRLFAWWQLASERAEVAARGELALMDPPTLLAARRDIAVIPVPEDIVELRQREPLAAAHWRLQTRERIQTAMADGYRIIGMSNDGYVLEK
jgi:predicted GNAT superfamily acetyltransferase